MRPPRTLRCVTLLAVLALPAGVARAGSGPAAAVEAGEQLDALLDRIAADVGDGRPMVAHAHVALCDNSIITCGGKGLGAGDDLRRNLYWATGGGLRGWFARRGSGWKLVAELPGNEPGVLTTLVWRRRVEPGARWARHGLKRPFDLYVVAQAWRGVDIDKAVAAYLRDLYGTKALDVELPDGQVLHAGGAAHVVAYVGHDRWMDVPFQAPEAAAPPRAPVKGTMAIACMTAQYIGALIQSPARLPLVLTTTLVFAGSHAFEGPLRALADAGSLEEIRLAAARAYAEGQRDEARRYGNVFVNASHPRWRPGRAGARAASP